MILQKEKIKNFVKYILNSVTKQLVLVEKLPSRSEIKRARSSLHLSSICEKVSKRLPLSYVGF